MRVAFFYRKARESLWMASLHIRGSLERAYFIKEARNWRDLARQTRSRSAGASRK